MILRHIGDFWHSKILINIEIDQRYALKFIGELQATTCCAHTSKLLKIDFLIRDAFRTKCDVRGDSNGN